MRLRNGAGVATSHQIPTLEEAMIVAKGKIWVNIDKGYDYFDLVEKSLKNRYYTAGTHQSRTSLSEGGG